MKEFLAEFGPSVIRGKWFEVKNNLNPKCP
jgi:hypothetical protein